MCGGGGHRFEPFQAHHPPAEQPQCQGMAGLKAFVPGMEGGNIKAPAATGKVHWHRLGCRMEHSCLQSMQPKFSS
jgi:hypothetical protein